MSNVDNMDTFVSVPDSLLASTQQILGNIGRTVRELRDERLALIEVNTRLMLTVLERDRVIGELRAELRRIDGPA